MRSYRMDAREMMDAGYYRRAESMMRGRKQGAHVSYAGCAPFGSADKQFTVSTSPTKFVTCRQCDTTYESTHSRCPMCGGIGC